MSVNPNPNSEASLAAVQNFFQLGIAQDPALSQIIAPDSVFVADGDPGLFPLAGVQQGAEVLAEEQQVLQLVNPTLFQPFQYIANIRLNSLHSTTSSLCSWGCRRMGDGFKRLSLVI